MSEMSYPTRFVIEPKNLPESLYHPKDFFTMIFLLCDYFAETQQAHFLLFLRQNLLQLFGEMLAFVVEILGFPGVFRLIFC